MHSRHKKSPPRGRAGKAKRAQVLKRLTVWRSSSETRVRFCALWALSEMLVLPRVARLAMVSTLPVISLATVLSGCPGSPLLTGKFFVPAPSPLQTTPSSRSGGSGPNWPRHPRLPWVSGNSSRLSKSGGRCSMMLHCAGKFRCAIQCFAKATRQAGRPAALHTPRACRIT